MGPPANPEFRAAVEADVAQYGLESLRERLSQVDPLLAHKLHLHDQRRMIRALGSRHGYRPSAQPLANTI